MAHQTSENQRKQTTPHIVGRLMDADSFEGHVFYFSITSRKFVLVQDSEIALRPTDPKSVVMFS
jgi:hypothetical protein